VGVQKKSRKKKDPVNPPGLPPIPSAPPPVTITHYPFPFLRWEASSYSCAYDSLLTPLSVCWLQADEPWKSYMSTIFEDFTRVGTVPGRQLRSKDGLLYMYGGQEKGGWAVRDLEYISGLDWLSLAGSNEKALW
jgi:hypothetical protein